MSVLTELFIWVLLTVSGSMSGGAAGAASSTKAAVPIRASSLNGGAGLSGAGGTPASTQGTPSARATPARMAPEPAIDPSAPPTYARDVAPLFDLRCVKCHGAPFARNDLRLTSYANVMRGGETGTAVLPGDPEGSLLLKKVEGRDKPSMPPRRPLSKSEKELLRRWITAGAPP